MEQKYNARFLGANTPEGFISLFDELYDPAEDWRAISSRAARAQENPG